MPFFVCSGDEECRGKKKGRGRGRGRGDVGI